MTAGVTDLFREPRYDASPPQPTRSETAQGPKGDLFIPGRWYFFSTLLSAPVKQLWIFRVDEVGRHPYRDHRRAFGELELLVIVLGVPGRLEPQWEAYCAEQRDFPYWADNTTAAGVDVVTALSGVTT
ncbi:hypothetical protein [Streptomyces sp. NPDC002746]